MDDLLAEFLTETAECMDTLDVELVRLEQNPSDPEILGNIFRLVHTVKGTCGFLGLPRLEAVAHASENVLGRVRDGLLEVTPAAISLVLESLDRIKAVCAELERTEQEPAGDDAELIQQLNTLAEGGGAPPPALIPEEPEPASALAPALNLAPAQAAEPGADVMVAEVADDDFAPTTGDGGFPVAAELLEEFEQATKGNADPIAPDPVAEAPAGLPSPATAEPAGLPSPEAAEQACLPSPDAPAIDQPAPEQQPVHEPTQGAHDFLVAAEEREAAEEDAVAKQERVSAASSKAPKSSDDAAKSSESSVAAQSIRVGVDVLENLMTMVSELVLTRNQLLQIQRAQDTADEFAAPLQSLNYIVSELQEGVMKTRMQPIGNAWSKLSRIIRDLAHDMGKKIDLRMHGQETELDRQVLELIRDPLTHMVRNSADHGLETPKERLAAGKPEIGVVYLNAFHEGGHIIIEIKDDGRGLNMEKIKSKIIANGLATEAELAAMPDTKIQQFVFKAGFSTAEKVTNVSGRGVGMDVVRTNIERIGGSVEMVSVEGKGSTFRIKIPLTLAIVSALVVECGGERFSIPQISVLELVRASANSEHRIELLNDTPVLRLRERLLPLVSLRSLLHLKQPAAAEPLLLPAPDTASAAQPASPADAAQPAPPVSAAQPASSAIDEREDSFIVVTQVGAHTFGIIVDRVFDTEEIAVKPVAPILRDIQLYSGNTILGDGSVIMILDPNGIAAASGEVSLSSGVHEEALAAASTHRAEKVTMLVFRAGTETPKAVPLALVARLEEIDVAAIEFSTGQMLTQYRGKLVPLVHFDPAQKLTESGRQPVLVFSENDRTMGLVVDEIVDIVDVELGIELSSGQTGVLGSAIISGAATEVIDAGHFLTQAFPDWFTKHSEENGGGDDAHVLLVDDSPFFRNMLAPLLEISGYRVTAAESAQRASELCEQGQEFDVIISDIEMPGMNGFEFAQFVKDGSRWQQTPMVALSSHTSTKDLERGRQVGFTDYVAKFDRSTLLQALTETLAVKRNAA